MTDRPRLASGIVDGNLRVDLLPVGPFYWRAGTAGGELWHHRRVTDLRPLYVLDLDDDIARHLVVSLRNGDRDGIKYPATADQLEAQIPAPTLPDEPGGLGAVVIVTPPGEPAERWAHIGNKWRRLDEPENDHTWAALHQRGAVTIVAAGL